MSQNEFAGIKTGDYRYLNLQGKLGYNSLSIHSYWVLSDHNLNNSHGSMEYWFFPLEDLTPSYTRDYMKINHPMPQAYTLISDNKKLAGKDEASFAMVFEKRWHPQFYTKMYKGDLDYRLVPPAKAFTSSEHMYFQKNKWYQVIYTWDRETYKYRMYVNGVLVAVESQFDQLTYSDKVGDKLYIGNPSLCIGKVKFHSKFFEANDVTKCLKPQSYLIDAETSKYLSETFEGSKEKQLNFELNQDWTEKLSLSLKEKNHLDKFYIQGYEAAPSITEQGLLIETPLVRQHKDTLELQVYLWSKQTFEGDIYIEYEFKSLQAGGLSLLMVNAGGMQREDFMKDYPKRENGSMVTVYGEDVRNYHWEYYREMNDTRNDVISGGLTKNPFHLPLAYGCLNIPFDHSKWHKLQYLQVGGKIVGAIDGRIVVEATDRVDTNSGGIYDFGHIAIRCMVHTKLLVKNIKVFNKELEYKVIKPTKTIDIALEYALEKVRALNEKLGDKYPSPASYNNRYEAIDNNYWTTSFFSGLQVLSYMATHDDSFKKKFLNQVDSFQQRLEDNIELDTHDLGFLYEYSSLAAYKFFDDAKARETGIEAAKRLMKRYYPEAGIIQAWGDLDNPDFRGRMIIDCNMNLPLLYWASDELNDKKYYEAAYKHVLNAKNYIMREDNSTFHTYHFDPDSGKALYGTTQQGYSDTSCWARGQAWAIYGFALSYKYTKDESLLKTSMKAADYFLAHLPEDNVCYWDLIFTDGSNQERDSSAAAIAVCGLLELAQHLREKATYYSKKAEEIMTSLIDKYSVFDDSADGLILHSVYSKPHDKGVDECSTWGDYYYMEALLRLKGLYKAII